MDELEGAGWEQQQQLEEQRRFEEEGEFKHREEYLEMMAHLKAYNEAWQNWAEE